MTGDNIIEPPPTLSGLPDEFVERAYQGAALTLAARVDKAWGGNEGDAIEDVKIALSGWRGLRDELSRRGLLRDEELPERGPA